MEEFDRESSPLTFHHLPYNTDERLRFELTSSLDNVEILDYALLEGDSREELRIKSFFNFGRQKFTNQRLVTIMLDTIRFSLWEILLCNHSQMASAMEKFWFYNLC